MKKFLALLLAVLSIFAMVACAGDPAPAPAPVSDGDAVVEEGKVLNIYVWNTEFVDRFNAYYDASKLGDVKVNFVTNPNQGSNYQDKLDAALINQFTADADDKVDMFLVEADYCTKYVNSGISLDVYGDLGLTADDTKNMYQYTKDVMTTADGKLKGLSWQACPAGFIYRYDIAEAVLGTGEPDAVQAMLSDWDKFDAVAQQMKDAGYFMISGFDDAYRVFSNNVTAPWVSGDTLTVPAEIKDWIDMTKIYTDNGFNNKANLWSAESGAGAKKDGKVFGYFGPGWFFDFSLSGWAADDADAPKELGNGSCGLWHICEGPQGFFWGGTWICAAAGTDNPTLVKDIMYTMTCDSDVLVKIAKDMGDFTNDEPAMNALAADTSYGNAMLGGQNHIAVLLANATKIEMKYNTVYDQGCNEKIQAAFADYFNGNVDYDTAIANFEKNIKAQYVDVVNVKF